MFPTVVLSERILDPHVQRIENVTNAFFCIAIQTGTFNDAELLDGAPRLPSSLIGVIHRTLIEGGHTPTWRLHEGTYRSVVGVGDYLEVTI